MRCPFCRVTCLHRLDGICCIGNGLGLLVLRICCVQARESLPKQLAVYVAKEKENDRIVLAAGWASALARIVSGPQEDPYRVASFQHPGRISSCTNQRPIPKDLGHRTPLRVGPKLDLSQYMRNNVK